MGFFLSFPPHPGFMMSMKNGARASTFLCTVKILVCGCSSIAISRSPPAMLLMLVLRSRCTNGRQTADGSARCHWLGQSRSVFGVTSLDETCWYQIDGQGSSTVWRRKLTEGARVGKVFFPEYVRMSLSGSLSPVCGLFTSRLHS